MSEEKKKRLDLLAFECAMGLVAIQQNIRDITDPEILKEIELEKAAEEKERLELLKKGIIRLEFLDPGDVMRISKKIKEREAKKKDNDGNNN